MRELTFEKLLLKEFGFRFNIILGKIFENEPVLKNQIVKTTTDNTCFRFRQHILYAPRTTRSMNSCLVECLKTFCSLLKETQHSVEKETDKSVIIFKLQKSRSIFRITHANKRIGYTVHYNVENES